MFVDTIDFLGGWHNPAFVIDGWLGQQVMGRCAIGHGSMRNC